MDSTCCAVIQVNRWELSKVLDIKTQNTCTYLNYTNRDLFFILSVDKSIYHRQNI